MSEFDVIVIGGGPGGSNAAAAALRAGLRVAQIEAKRFPRVKPCAGGLTIKSCRSLPPDLFGQLRGESRAVEFNVWRGRGQRFLHRKAILRFVHRPDWDNWLVRRNQRHAGFEFSDGERVRAIEFAKHFTIRTDWRTLRAPQLIAADGAYSLANRVFKVSSPRAMATAVEVVLSSPRVTLSRPLLPCFDFGAVPRGYGWVFPKDDHWSVGLYTLATGVCEIRKRLAHYLELKGFICHADPLESFEAHRIPVGGVPLRVPEFPLYVVGDAGGFADAVTGEGIYHALESGRLAGLAAARLAAKRGSSRDYYRRLWPAVLCDTALTYGLSKIIYRHPKGAIGALGIPLIWRPLIEGYAAGATVTKCFLGGLFYCLRSAAFGTSVQVRTGPAPFPEESRLIHPGQ